jgi:hypothetical protein
MSAKNTSGTVLIRDNTLLPAGLALEREAFLPGWRIVQNISAYELGRKIQQAHWNFFYLAGETKAIVFGREQSGALCRAAKKILAKRQGQKCNALEITTVTSKTFLGIPFLSVAANSRHIQESLCLIPGEADTAVHSANVPGINPESKERQRPVEVYATEHPRQVSSV